MTWQHGKYGMHINQITASTTKLWQEDVILFTPISYEANIATLPTVTSSLVATQGKLLNFKF